MRFHRASADKYGRDIQSHCSHQHTGSHLVAVGDANHGIGLVGIHHILHRVGNDVAAGQRIEHTIVTHSNTVVNGNGVELRSIAALSLYLLLHYLSYLVEMGVTRHKLGERINYSNDGLAKLFALHACSNPQGTSPCHAPSFRAHSTSQLMFHSVI